MKAKVIILIIIVAIFILFKPDTYIQKPENIKTDEKILMIIRKMLKDIDNLFQNNDITYWACGGTLLGAVRHQDIIPWDDDADICILKQDEQKLLKLEQSLKIIGYGLTSFWGGYKIFPLNGFNINYQNRNWHWSKTSQDIINSEKFNYKYPFIDVFTIIKNNSKNIYYPDNIKVTRTWPTEYYEIEDLFPLRKYRFNNFTIVGPNNPIPYLDRVYEKDWPFVGYKQYDHRNQMMFDKKKFNL